MIFIRKLGFFVKIGFCRKLTLYGEPRRSTPWVPDSPYYAVMWKPVIKERFFSMFWEMVLFFLLSEWGSVATRGGFKGGSPSLWVCLKKLFFTVGGFSINIYIVRRFYRLYVSRLGTEILYFQGFAVSKKHLFIVIKHLFIVIKHLFIVYKTPFHSLVKTRKNTFS